jgi:3-oxoacyl-[acyl-carrier protein] reductase
MKNRNAKIVNFSGGGAATPFPNYSAYAAGKIAVVRLTENLAEEFKPLGISVNAVAPGFVVTRLHDQTLRAGEKAGKSFLEGTKKQIEKGGVPPEKAADLTSLLLSGQSDGINGKFISAPWDPWGETEFIEKLKSSKHLATLRRIDRMNFTETSPA